MTREVHVMVDLETLSKRSDAAIVQLAAIAFDPQTGEILSRFNEYVNESCVAGERVGHVDIGTIGWWLKQKGAAALGEKITGEDGALWLAYVLGEFDQWFANLAADTCEDDAAHFTEGSEQICVWAHGATFDIPILASAYDRAQVGYVPWNYRAPRDTRTLYALAPGGMPVVAEDETRKHDALYDCEVQVQQVCGALKALRVQAENAATSIAANAAK